MTVVGLVGLVGGGRALLRAVVRLLCTVMMRRLSRIAVLFGLGVPSREPVVRTVVQGTHVDDPPRQEENEESDSEDAVSSTEP